MQVPLCDRLTQRNDSRRIDLFAMIGRVPALPPRCLIGQRETSRVSEADKESSGHVDSVVQLHLWLSWAFLEFVPHS
jgi:hypothetical protein